MLMLRTGNISIGTGGGTQVSCDHGISSEHCESGREMLARLALYDYDILLIDLDLPDMPGHEAIRLARAAGHSTPCIMLASPASAPRQIKVKALDLGADVHVLELALEPLLARRLPKAQPVPRFPAVRRDIAVDLPEEISWSQIELTVRGSLGERLKELCLFDRYSGKGVESGRKSLAMGLILQDASRTLTDDDADRCVRNAVSALEAACEAKLRG